MKYKDEIISNTTVNFSVLDKIRILFSRSVHVCVRTKTENLPGAVVSESNATVDRIFPKKLMGGCEIAME